MLVRKPYKLSIYSGCYHWVVARIALPALIIFFLLSVLPQSVHAGNGASNKNLLRASYLIQASNADIFYRRALKLERLGVRAPFDDDFKPLVSQARASYRRVEQQNESAARRGKPLYCNINNEQLSPREVLKELGNIPTAKRQNISLTRAFLIIAQDKYPCR